MPGADQNQRSEPSFAALLEFATLEPSRLGSSDLSVANSYAHATVGLGYGPGSHYRPCVQSSFTVCFFH